MNLQEEVSYRDGFEITFLKFQEYNSGRVANNFW